MTRIIVDAEKVMVCGGCTELVAEDGQETVYECGECGNEFTKSENDDSNRCSDCNKFAAKTDAKRSACCSEELLEGVRIVGNDDEELILTDDEWEETT